MEGDRPEPPVSLILTLTGALTAGAVHVLGGPDHLAAVLPLAVQDRARAARTGAAWGLGHGAGVVLLGGLGQLLRGRLDLAGLSGGAEVAVGALLVVMGLLTLRRSRLLVVHSHPHAAGPAHPHVHLADPSVGTGDHAHAGAHAGHRHSAFGFGLLHGVAGGSHLLGALPALALPPREAALYLGAYLAAAVGVMAAFALGAGRLVPAARVRGATAASGALAVVVGVVWVGASW